MAGLAVGRAATDLIGTTTVRTTTTGTKGRPPMHPHGPEHHDQTHDHGDPEARVHGMAVIGTDTFYLSHLPMFMPLHDYQVILEAEFTGPDGRPDPGYVEDRKQHPGLLYTFRPEPFVLPQLLPDGGPPKRSSVTGDVFRHHYERTQPPNPRPVEVASGITVTVRTVVHGRKFEPGASRPPQLEYLLFGRGQELFLAHLISAPPDFDQLIQVRVDTELDDGDLARGLRVTVPDRADEARERIRPNGGPLAAVLRPGDQDIKIGVDPGQEFYLEENELAE
jgi:hypothetical protein